MEYSFKFIEGYTDDITQVLLVLWLDIFHTINTHMHTCTYSDWHKIKEYINTLTLPVRFSQQLHVSCQMNNSETYIKMISKMYFRQKAYDPFVFQKLLSYISELKYLLNFTDLAYLQIK